MTLFTLGVAGDEGSFSAEAGMLYAARAEFQPTLRYLIDMEGVLAAVEAGQVDLGIFPIVNLRGGLVQPALLAMGKHLFLPFDELWLNVHQCLLTLPDTDMRHIKKIVSHPQGLRQCQRYLQEKFNGVPQIAWIDTAKAARDLAAGNLDKTTAVIAPAAAAKLYHLTVLDHNIEDDQPNLTAFILVKKLGDTACQL